MRPRQAFAHEGRLNPKGISFTYLALEEETALAEVRPWLNQEISVAKFQTIQELKVIDLTQCQITRQEAVRLKHSWVVGKDRLIIKELNDEQYHNLIWFELNEAFSMPMVNSEDSASYAPTQIIAELIKSKGYDGVMFKSSVTDGHNLVLFDGSNVVFVDCCLREMVEIQYSFKEVHNQFTEC